MYPLHHSPRKVDAAGASCTPMRQKAQRFLRPLGLLFHARPQRWSRRPESHRHGHDAQRGLSPPCLLFQPRRDKLVRTEGIAPSWAFARRLLGPTCLLFHHVRKKLEHPQGRAPCCLSYQDSPSLSTGWMQSGRSGRTRTFVARQGVAFTARCICCSATLRKKWGLERDSHPRPSPYEGAALTAAPSSQNGGTPR